MTTKSDAAWRERFFANFGAPPRSGDETRTEYVAMWRARCGHCDAVFAAHLVGAGLNEEASRSFVADGAPPHAIIDRIEPDHERFKKIDPTCVHLGGKAPVEQGAFF